MMMMTTIIIIIVIIVLFIIIIVIIITVLASLFSSSKDDYSRLACFLFTVDCCLSFVFIIPLERFVARRKTLSFGVKSDSLVYNQTERYGNL